MMVGYRPQDGDRIAVIEDVVTAGTAVKGIHPAVQAGG